MALYVNTNVSSINAQRKLANSTLALNTSYQRLSSGLRINSSKDDAAGLQIADRLTSQINGLNQGNRNANDGIALAQTIEGALDETTNMLQRIRTLAVQAANGTNTAKDRKALQEEVNSLSQEITRIGQKTTFAGAHVLMSVGAKNGNTPLDTLKNAAGEYYFQVGANAQDMITLAMSRGFHLSGIASMAVLTVQKAKGDISKSGLILSNNVVHWVVCEAKYAQVTLANIDKMIEAVDSRRAALGAVQNHESLRKQPLQSLKVA